MKNGIAVTYLVAALLFIFGLSNCSSQDQSEKAGHAEPLRVRTGAEVLLKDHLSELEGKRIGLVMNPTARVHGIHMLDTLLSLNVNVAALFAPEHGFRGEAGAGEVIEDGVDQATGLPVYSLYGKTKKPTADMLQGVDILLFDMQDVGARFYTYNVTLGLILEAAADSGIPVWVLDRPNPAGGKYVAGWVLDEQHSSFVGAWPIPMAHGMTLGELAIMMVGEGWLNTDREPDLRVIEMENWKREMTWEQTGISWYPPSPNLPTFEHAYMYLGTVLFEGSTLSEGRGTPDPFLTIGSPRTSLTPEEIQTFNSRFPSVEVRQVSFTPKSIPGKAANPKYKEEACMGVALSVRDFESLEPVEFGVALLEFLVKQTPGAELSDFIYKLAGSEEIKSFKTNWEQEVASFRDARRPYLLYE